MRVVLDKKEKSTQVRWELLGPLEVLASSASLTVSLSNF